jgi:acetyltransferase-like isoleucine patch superfamily enzyme
MKTKIFKQLQTPAFYSLPLKFLLSMLRINGLYLAAWWYGGHCVIGKAVRVKSPTLFQGQGELVIHDRVTLGYAMAGGVNLSIILQPRESESIIQIGQRTAIMNGCEIIACSSIVIGADCRIGPHTLIYDADFHGLAPEVRNELGKTAKVRLEDNVWIGSRSIILKGVTIEKDSVVAAGSVVTKNVIAGSIVAGNPARQVGSAYAKT